MEHEIDWTTAEFRRGDVTVHVRPFTSSEWELLFTRLASSTTWPFGDVEVTNSVIRVTEVPERRLDWLREHLNAAVEATDRALVARGVGAEPETQRRFTHEDDPDSTDRELTERLRRFADRGR